MVSIITEDDSMPALNTSLAHSRDSSNVAGRVTEHMGCEYYDAFFKPLEETRKILKDVHFLFKKDLQVQLY